MSKYSGLESLLQKIENVFNKYLDTHNSNFYTTTFIIKMNEFLSHLPREMIYRYHWKRFDSQLKPSLHLVNVNRIVKFLIKDNKYKVIKPDNLDTFLIK